MAERQRIAVELNPVSSSRWSVPASTWPGFHLLEIRVATEGRTVPFRQDGDEIVLENANDVRPTAIIEIDKPSDIEAAKLELERSKARTEDVSRNRTLLFSIGSAVLTALVTLTVAFVSRPSSNGLPVNVDAVQSCEDSLQRLSTLTEMQNQTLNGLSSEIHKHVDTCNGMLEDVIHAAAKKDTQ